MATAWVAGGSGLVGGVLLRALLQGTAYESVISIGRRTVALVHPGLTQVVADLTANQPLEAATPPEVAFCCLGTTLAKAGSREAFRKVDHGAVLHFAREARRRGARVLVHVSAMGSNPRSLIFYNRVKGEVERDLTQLDYPSVYAMRPSFLDGERQERRPLERVTLGAARALGPLLGKYRPTPVDALVRAMLAAASSAAPGAHEVEQGVILGA